MRRRAIGQDQPSTSRRGVQASDATRKTRAVSPNSFRASEIGFAPRPPRAARQRIQVSGASEPAKTAGFNQGRFTRSLEVLPEVHAAVEAGDLFRVTVEGERRPPASSPMRCSVAWLQRG